MESFQSPNSRGVRIRLNKSPRAGISPNLQVDIKIGRSTNKAQRSLKLMIMPPVGISSNRCFCACDPPNSFGIFDERFGWNWGRVALIAELVLKR